MVLVVGYIHGHAVVAYEVHRAFAASDPVGEGTPVEHWKERQRLASEASPWAYLVASPVVLQPVDIDWERQHSEPFQGALHRSADSPVDRDIAAAAAVDRDEVDIEERLPSAEGVVVGIVESVAADKQWAACLALVALADP